METFDHCCRKGGGGLDLEGPIYTSREEDLIG